MDWQTKKPLSDVVNAVILYWMSPIVHIPVLVCQENEHFHDTEDKAFMESV